MKILAIPLIMLLTLLKNHENPGNPSIMLLTLLKNHGNPVNAPNHASDANQENPDNLPNHASDANPVSDALLPYICKLKSASSRPIVN